MRTETFCSGAETQLNPFVPVELVRKDSRQPQHTVHRGLVERRPRVAHADLGLTFDLRHPGLGEE